MDPVAGAGSDGSRLPARKRPRQFVTLPAMPFGYYKRLSRADKAIYRRSEEVKAIRLPMPVELQAAAAALQAALQADQRAGVERVSQALADALCFQLEVARVKVLVLEVRPSFTGGELHGLYVPA